MGAFRHAASQSCKLVGSARSRHHVYLVRFGSPASSIAALFGVNPGSQSVDERVERLAGWLFGQSREDYSLFAAQTVHPADVGHSLGFVAQRMGSTLSAQGGSGLEPRVSVFLRMDWLSKRCDIKRSPGSNLFFSPADPFHYDVTPHNSENFAKDVLNGIDDAGEEAVRMLILVKKDAYLPIAALAYAYCAIQYGSDLPPTHFELPDKTKATAEEQTTVLKNYVFSKVEEQVSRNDKNKFEA